MHHLFSSLRLLVEIIGGRRCLNLALQTDSLRVDIGREVMVLHQVLDHTARGTENCYFWFVVSHCFHLLPFGMLALLARSSTGGRATGSSSLIDLVGWGRRNYNAPASVCGRNIRIHVRTRLGKIQD